MSACVYCGEDKGKRECPAFGGLISPSCCGENRGIRIDCPPDCRHYVKNERYQRNRVAPDFHDAWMQQTGTYYRQRQFGVLDFLVFLEVSIYRYFQSETRATDGDLVSALEALKRQLSPVQVIEAPSSRLGQHLAQAAQQYGQQQGTELDPDHAQQAIEALLETIRALENGDAPREALHGLLGHVEGYIGVPDDADPEASAEEGAAQSDASRIVTPDAFNS